MDPITLYATATTAVSAIKGVIQLGKDISECTDDLNKFFSAKDEIENEAAKADKAKKDGKSIDAQAMKNVLYRKKLADEEYKLKEMMYLSGNKDLYLSLVQERHKLRRAAKDSAAREVARKKLRRHNIEIAVGATLIIGVGIASVWYLISKMIEMAAAAGHVPVSFVFF